MYAVFRETTYAPDKPIHESAQFREFHTVHAQRRGYKGTVVAEVGGGRYLTVTLWETTTWPLLARRWDRLFRACWIL